jgi:ribosomal protein S6--L-glutamate ligase
MKAAVMSLGSKSSTWIMESMKKYFDSVDAIDLRDVEVTLGAGKLDVLYEGKTVPQYSCIYARGSFRYATLLRSVTRSLFRSSYMPIKPETFTLGHDKLLTHLALQHFGVPMPATYLASSTRAAKKILNEISYPVVLKFPHGTQGKGVMFAESYAAASSMLDALIALKQPFLIQEYIETGGVDVRAIVVGDKVVASMKRKAVRGEFRANIHAGGTGQACALDAKTQRIAVDTAASIGADICAVDMLESPKGPLVIEANLSPGLQGITKATGIDLADKIAKFLFEKSEVFSARDRDETTMKIFEDLGLTHEMAQQIITHLDFRGDRILLPKIATGIAGFNEKDEVVLKIEKGKINVERV